VLALGDRRMEALPIYRDVLRTSRELGLQLDEILWAIDMTHVLGPDEPEAAAAATRAREIIERLGGSSLAALLEPAERAGSRGVGRPRAAAETPPVSSA
jgi:hypothetical protein